MSLRAVLLFHLETGVRVLWRLGVLQIALVLFLIGQLPEPRAFLEQAAAGVGAGEWGWRLALGLWCVVVAAAASPRERSILRGWGQHLPVSGVTRRRGMVLALGAAEVVPILAWVLLWCAGWAMGGTPAPATLVACIPVAVAAAATTVALAPVSRLLPWIALVLAAWSGWVALAGSVLCLIAIDRSPVVTRTTRGSRLHLATRVPAGWLPVVLSARALGWSLASVSAAGVFVVAAVALARRNNPELSPDQVATLVRFGCGIAVVWVTLQFASRLSERRPPWPWSRSWPWSSAHRVANDVLLLIVLTVPAIVAALMLHPVSVIPVAVLSLFTATRAAAAMRRGGDSLTALGRRVTIESGLALLVVGLAPTGLVLLAGLLPWAWRNAVRREQAHKVGALREQHYLALGDSLS